MLVASSMCFKTPPAKTLCWPPPLQVEAQIEAVAKSVDQASKVLTNLTKEQQALQVRNTDAASRGGKLLLLCTLLGRLAKHTATTHAARPALCHLATKQLVCRHALLMSHTLPHMPSCYRLLSWSVLTS